MIFVFFGTNVQNSYGFFCVKTLRDECYRAGAIVLFLLFFYYAIASYITFIAYK